MPARERGGGREGHRARKLLFNDGEKYPFAGGSKRTRFSILLVGFHFFSLLLLLVSLFPPAVSEVH